jgi:uncharacterized protein YjbI with pentapeptide repeats
MGDWMVILACVAVAGLFVLACWYLPIRITSGIAIDDRRKLTELQDSIRRTIALIAAGAVLVLAFSWTFFRDLQTLDVSRAQMTNQQFAEAARLMAGNPDGRVAAIYAMENIVNSRGEYHSPVVNTLTSMIQTQQRQLVAYPKGSRPPPIGNDMKAALYVIGRFPRPKNPPLDFRGFHLASASFASSRAFREANFRGAKLFAADFTGATLAGAKFEGAEMSDFDAYGNVNRPGGFTWDLAQSKDWKDVVRFSYTTFFDSADLTNARFDRVYVNGVSFKGANLLDANFSGANLSRADFTGAENLQKAKFDGACYHELFKPEGLSEELLKAAKVTSGCR